MGSEEYNEHPLKVNPVRILEMESRISALEKESWYSGKNRFFFLTICSLLVVFLLLFLLRFMYMQQHARPSEEAGGTATPAKVEVAIITPKQNDRLPDLTFWMPSVEY